MSDKQLLRDKSISAQDQYYAFMLREAQAKSVLSEDVKWLSVDEKKALSTIGEKEKIETKVLARLRGMGDSSAEFIQVKSFTDCETREEIAKVLAEKYYEKFTTEEVLNRFVGATTAKKEILEASRTESARLFTAWGASEKK